MALMMVMVPQSLAMIMMLPISEGGDVTVKFIKLRELFQDLKVVSMELPEYLTYDMIPLMKTNLDHHDPLPMELLNINNCSGQGYVWILYRTQVHPN